MTPPAAKLVGNGHRLERALEHVNAAQALVDEELAEQGTRAIRRAEQTLNLAIKALEFAIEEHDA